MCVFVCVCVARERENCMPCFNKYNHTITSQNKLDLSTYYGICQVHSVHQLLRHFTATKNTPCAQVAHVHTKLQMKNDRQAYDKSPKHGQADRLSKGWDGFKRQSATATMLSIKAWKMETINFTEIPTLASGLNRRPRSTGERSNANNRSCSNNPLPLSDGARCTLYGVVWPCKHLRAAIQLRPAYL